MRYEIKGDTLPVVVCYLENGERMITERGSMSWMSPNMKMETTSNGGIGKAFGRMFSGEALFQNRYTATGGNGMIAFASSFPGQIVARQIAPGQELIVQKSGFLASEEGVDLSIFFQKKFGAGFFGGEGFIMQRLSGYLAAMDATCSMEIQTVPGLKNMVFGGEGVFNTVVTGPGHVWLQTMPISSVAGELLRYMPAGK